MDVYHKVLVKLYEVTGGKDSETVNLKELVKGMGFLSSYPEIFQQLSRQSWVAETPRPDVVKMTHWGVKEAKKAGVGGADGGQALKKEVTRLVADARELVIYLEQLEGEPSKDHAAKAEKKLDGILTVIRKLKETL
jgi:hypothetical protein